MSSIALYVGVIKLGQKNVLVQELYCIETLARVNCICLDKTGTITDGTMVVKNEIDYENVHGLANKNIISAMLNALPDRNMTSEALIQRYGLGKRMKELECIPFSSQRKFQAVTFETYGTFLLGAPEFVLGPDFVHVKEDVEKYAKSGYRVLCLAHREGNIENNTLPDSNVVVLSMILIEDNIRPDAIETIKYFKESGVEVRVISGDNPVTVSMISQRAGVPDAEKYISLDGLTDQEVRRAALEYTVFGRVSPTQKKLIVQTLKENGRTVAMTGDGVNDILALREADCSIAIASGSEATRNCSHLVLLDSNFGSMPSVVAEGRRVINNVTSVASLFLTKTIFSLLLGIIAIIRGDYPISAGQLILIDTLAIGLPSLFLVNEPNNNPVVGKFLVNVIRKALPGALTIVILSLVIFSLSESLVLDSITSTTILVIVATHTCLMVLFKACHPFNPLRKGLCITCYGLFLIAIIVLPTFLEFKPLHSRFEYYSSDLELNNIINYPKIDVSKSGKYVIDGKYTDINATGENYTLVSKFDSTENQYLYALKTGDNIKMTSFKVLIPKISYDNNGNILAAGYKINNLTYSDDLYNKLSIDSNGNVYYNRRVVTTTLTRSDSYFEYENKYGVEKSHDVVYSILPKVKLENGEYIVQTQNGEEYTFDAPQDIIKKFKTDELIIRLSTSKTSTGGYELIINDEKVKDNEGNYFEVKLPNISTNGNILDETQNKNEVYFNALSTGYSLFSYFGALDTDYPDLSEYKLYYIYDNGGNKIYYSDTLKSIVDISTEIDETTELSVNVVSKSDFVFNDIDKYDFKKYRDTNNSIIDVNNKTNYLSIIPEENQSVYYIKEGDNVKSTNISLQVETLGPEITVSSQSARGDDYYVIDGYLTDYKVYVGNDLNPKMNKHNYLVIGGITTDYKLIKNVHYVEISGGTVRALTIDKLIFLFMLMLLSAPIMKLLQFSIPWIKKQFNGLQKFLNKI